ncbi:MAG: hypothetical protein HQL98_02770 [Magnetococcales bacterium]|nr:hypothetical protein [Magnetococcales bacterium]
MKSKATWGVVPATDKLLWVRLLEHDTLMFETGMAVIPGGERGVVAGLSAVNMAVRKSVLPFSRRDQIWSVLPQEAMDTLVQRFEDPCFAMQWEPVEQGSSVLFALCERHTLDGLLATLAQATVKPRGVVMAELGAWPLLEAATLIGTQGSMMVVDGSASPVSVYAVTEGRLRELRLVAPATSTLDDTALLEEVAWLLTDLASRLPEAEAAGLIFLGRTREFWQPVWERHPANRVEIPPLEALGQGLKQWEWLRPAGLALAAARGQQERLMDFLHGAGERQWRTWLDPWRGAGVLALILLLVWGGEEALRFTRAKARHDRLKAETEALFREALPHIPVIVEPLLQLKQALGQNSQANKEGEFPTLSTWIGLIQTTVPADTQVKWHRLRYEPGELQLHGEVPSYNHLDRVRAALLPLSKGKETRMDEARIAPESKTVRFRLGLP